MAELGLRLRHLGFYGPHKPPALIEFGAGLNVIYGASDTGKSFIVETIDFMLGGKPPLRDIPERIGYDRILLGIETLSRETFTLLRSVDGGNLRVYTGLYNQVPAEDTEAQELADHHNERNSTNLSMFLLERCGLAGKRVRRNARGDTSSLSFRNIARLLIVTETEITQQRSPLSDGNFVADTPNFATFKLLLTGVDDSALAMNRPQAPEEQSREAQRELLDELLDDYRARLRELTKNPDELSDQLGRVEVSLEGHARQLRTTEAEFRGLADRRRELRQKFEEGCDRSAEVASLLERFALLERHYVSDIERLKAIEEGGTLFDVLGPAVCPLCGAEPAHHRPDAECEGNIEVVVSAARKEIAKIELLRTELADTVKSLQREQAGFARKLPSVEQELIEISRQIDRLVAPKLSNLRASYAEYADKRGEIREALALFQTVQDIERRRSGLAKDEEEQKPSAVSEGDLPTAVADSFAQTVETILKEWHFPEAGRVHFDPKTRDLVIGGKQRSARGKGLRAVTHAAFSIGLAVNCRKHKTPHPGFVILDSPLLAYREPDGTEDDLRGTDLKDKFYEYLQLLPTDQQVIVVENTDPPEPIKARPQATMFSKNPHHGRYGLFPVLPDLVMQTEGRG